MVCKGKTILKKITKIITSELATRQSLGNIVMTPRQILRYEKPLRSNGNTPTLLIRKRLIKKQGWGTARTSPPPVSQGEQWAKVPLCISKQQFLNPGKAKTQIRHKGNLHIIIYLNTFKFISSHQCDVHLNFHACAKRCSAHGVVTTDLIADWI